MKLSKKQAKTMLDGWEYVVDYNEKHNKNITKEQFVEAYFETLKNGKEFCVTCEFCNKC